MTVIFPRRKHAVVFFAAFFLLTAPVRADELQECHRSIEEWKSCATDSDCAIIPGLCGEMNDASNVAHQQEAADCNGKLRAEVKCASNMEPRDFPPMKAVCEAGVCKAEAVTK